MVFRVHQLQGTHPRVREIHICETLVSHVDCLASFLLLHRTPHGSWPEVVRAVAMRLNGEPGKVYTGRRRAPHPLDEHISARKIAGHCFTERCFLDAHITLVA